MHRLLVVAALTACTQAHADPKPFAAEELKAFLSQLASPELDGRAAGTDNEVKARKLIIERFKSFGITATEQPFEEGTKKLANIVAIVKGETDEIIVVGAHPDHVGSKHLGANDNGSGVTGVLAIAQAVAQRKAIPKRTIVFVTFSGEEIGLLGSEHFVAHPPDGVDLAKVTAFVNLDMIGSYNSTKAVYAFGSFPNTAPGKILDKLDDAYPKLRVGLGGHSVRGDQVGFCRAKIPYIFFWTPDNRCYHETCDTVDKIDWSHMSMIASLANDLVQRLADEKTDLAAARAKTGCGR